MTDTLPGNPPVRPAADRPFHILLVGAGGTGGYLAESIGRLLYADAHADLAADERDRLKLTIVDGDEVEPVNLLRQNFIRDDLGVNKAKALADGLEAMFGLDVARSGAYIASPDDLAALVGRDEDVVVIGAVDNNATRSIIEQFVASRPGIVGIDSGNSVTDGQVVVYGDERLLGVERLKALDPKAAGPKAPSVLFPELTDFSGLNALPQDQSCELHAMHAPQHMATNMVAADVVFMLLNKVLHSSLFPTYVWRFDISAVAVHPFADAGSDRRARCA